MAYNAMRYPGFASLPSPLLLNNGQRFDLMDRGRQVGLDMAERDLMREAGSLYAQGKTTGARNALLQGGKLDAGFGIEDRQIAAGNRARAARQAEEEAAWRAKSREREQTLWGRQDQEWQQGQTAQAEERRAKAAGLYANVYQLAGGDPEKLARLQQAVTAAGYDVSQFAQPGGGEAALAISGRLPAAPEQMTPYQRAQIEMDRERLELDRSKLAPSDDQTAKTAGTLGRLYDTLESMAVEGDPGYRDDLNSAIGPRVGTELYQQWKPTSDGRMTHQAIKQAQAAILSSAKSVLRTKGEGTLSDADMAILQQAVGQVQYASTPEEFRRAVQSARGIFGELLGVDITSRFAEPPAPASPGGTQVRASGQQTAPSAPQVGQIEDGHVFLGGDPANPSSWRPVP